MKFVTTLIKLLKDQSSFAHDQSCFMNEIFFDAEFFTPNKHNPTIIAQWLLNDA